MRQFRFLFARRETIRKLKYEKSPCRCWAKPVMSGPSPSFESCSRNELACQKPARKQGQCLTVGLLTETSKSGGNMNGLTWKAEDPGTARQGANLLSDEALESRL